MPSRDTQHPQLRGIAVSSVEGPPHWVKVCTHQLRGMYTGVQYQCKQTLHGTAHLGCLLVVLHRGMHPRLPPHGTAHLGCLLVVQHSGMHPRMGTSSWCCTG